MNRVSRSLGLVLALLLSACGDGGPAIPMSAMPPTSPREVVDRWIAAARAGETEAALTLGTTEWADKERSWKKSFTNAMRNMGWLLVEAEVRDPSTKEDGRVHISVGAQFEDPDGERESEGLRFVLEEDGNGIWRIVSLR